MKITRDRKTWRLMEVLKEATTFLQTKGIENPRLNAEHLMSRVLGLSRIDLYLRFEQPLEKHERDDYKTLLRRRAAHEPLQYILGEVEFMSLPFRVTPDVLIPRPETETLVERVVEEMDGQEKARILDIGVGCGNIAVSLAKSLAGAEVVGVDREEPILSLASENARKNRVERGIQFIVADVRDENFVQAVGHSFDVVVSNPPYVSSEEWEKLPEEIREYEPKAALCDGGDGLSFFRIIAQKGKEVLRRGGKLFFEAGDRQSARVQTILRESDYNDIVTFLDLNGAERVVRGVWT